jgi:hypothetical protein
LKEEALDCIKWRNRFGGGCGPVVWQITDDDDDDDAFKYEFYAGWRNVEDTLRYACVTYDVSGCRENTNVVYVLRRVVVARLVYAGTPIVVVTQSDG